MTFNSYTSAMSGKTILFIEESIWTKPSPIQITASGRYQKTYTQESQS